jgi:hypothetical protein
VRRREWRVFEFEHEVIDVAVVPVLTRFEGPDDRMADLLIVASGVPQRRLVAAADMAAGLTHAEVDPIPPAEGKAVHASVAAGYDVLDLIEMRTHVSHRLKLLRVSGHLFP